MFTNYVQISLKTKVDLAADLEVDLVVDLEVEMNKMIIKIK